MKLRALIVDDEIHARENLKYLLKNYCPEIEIVGIASTVEGARDCVNQLAPHVIFLDICMPSGIEGFDFLESLPEKNFQVVFVTAFTDHAIRALNANAIQHIMKPVDVDDLKSAVKRLITTRKLFLEDQHQLINYIKSLENLSTSMHPSLTLKTLTINHAKGFKIVDPNEFIYLEAEGNYTSVVFKNGEKYLDFKSIGVYEDLLDAQLFFRIHKSYIINILQVKEFLTNDDYFVVMKDNAKLPIAKLRVPGFVALYKEEKKL